MKFLNNIDGASRVITDPTHRFVTDSEKTAWNGKANASHTHVPSQISASGYTSGSLDMVTRQSIGSARSNKSFCLPANAIIIEYSSDGGVTWIDYGATNDQKRALFAETRGYSVGLGKCFDKTHTTDHQLRITIEPLDRYVSFDSFYCWYSSNGNNTNVEIQASTIGAKTTFTQIVSPTGISGWSGNNVIYFSPRSFGGYDGQNSNVYAYRMIFRMSSVSSTYGTSTISDIRFLGLNVWMNPNNMVAKDHIYSWDLDQNTFFPKNVECSQLVSKTTALPPFAVSSTVGVTNLNADFLDGKHASDFLLTSGGSLNGNVSIINNLPEFTIKNPSQGDTSIIFDRGGYANWRIRDNGGNLRFECDYTSGKVDYYDGMQLQFNTGDLRVRGNVYSNNVALVKTNDSRLSDARPANGGNASTLDGRYATDFSLVGHDHLVSQISDFPTSLPANGGNSATVNGHTVYSDVPSNAKFTDTVYTLPMANGTTLGGVKSGADVTISSGNIELNRYGIRLADLRLQGDGLNYAGKLSFGDGDVAYIAEETDNALTVKASTISFKNGTTEALKLQNGSAYYKGVEINHIPVGGSTIGGVKNGGNVTINADGTMTAPSGGGGSNVPFYNDVGGDVNSIRSIGCYSGSFTNSPQGNYGSLLVQHSDGNVAAYVNQIWIPEGQNMDIWYRTTNNASSWGAWCKLAKTNSPSLTGVPTAPTAPNGTNNNQIATTAFVLANAGGGGAPSVSETGTGNKTTMECASNGKVLSFENVPLGINTSLIMDNGMLFVNRWMGGDIDLDTATVYHSLFPQINSGSYTGNGSTTRTITLSRAPSFVIIYNERGAQGYPNQGLNIVWGGLALNGYPCTASNGTAIQIVSNGFTVGCNNNDIGTNYNGYKYYYIWG